jgi:hypothetical protein
MPLKIMREVTEWSGFSRQPNHVYLMDGDKAYAYVPWGKGKPFYFRTFQRLDRRGRKFVEQQNNLWKFDLTIQTEEPVAALSPDRTWRVASSKSGEYNVSLTNGVWTCSCPGHGFRGRCRHVDELRASVQPQV